jgi:glucose-6-phosphate dehydrogenase assembly protein OpcA
MATAVTSARILRELQDYWVRLAHDSAENGGVLKACAMTLIVAAEDDADANRVRETLGLLMHDHPSRAIVIRAPGPQLDARVFAECWKPFGKTQQICAEGIEIAPGAGGWEEVARFIVPLRVPDLPVVLWCRGALDRTYMYRKRYDPLYDLANKIVFDSRTVIDAEAAIEFLRGLRARGRRVADLHWARLTGWRELLAHLFDDRVMRPEEVQSARVRYGGGSATTCALYFAGWIRSALPTAKVAVQAEDAEPGISSLTLAGGGDSLSIRLADSCLEVEGAGRSYRAPLPPVEEEALMGAELRILGADPVWERVLDA